MRWLAAAGLLLLLGCQPLYLPPVPATPPPFDAQTLELDGSARLHEGRPGLRLVLEEVPIEGWLAVQWFSPANREVASQSVWLTPMDGGRELKVTLPVDVASDPGRWRAVLSFGGRLVRQLSVELPSTGK